MDVLRHYGKEFLIFEGEDQPNVFGQLEHHVSYQLRSGKVNPRALQHWSYLDTTRKLLRERYGLFPGADLMTYCPLRLTGKGEMSVIPTDQKVFRLIIYRGMVGFTCNYARGCPQKHCQAKERSVIDTYDLIALLDGKNLNHARKVVAKHFGVELGNFPKGEITSGKAESDERFVWYRYSVSKVKLRNLFVPQRRGTKESGAEAFINKALDLILNSREVPYDGYQGQTKLTVLFSKRFDWKTKLLELGSTARLFVWLHWQQAEKGGKLSLTNKQLAWHLGIGEKTMTFWRTELLRLGYLVVDKDEKSLSVRYDPISKDIMAGNPLT